MTHLDVVVRWRGELVAAKLVPLREGVRLGDGPGCEVSFPGTTLELRRDRFGWTLGGHRLLRGKKLTFGLKGLEITVDLFDDAGARRLVSEGPDIRLLVLTAALVLLASSLQAAGRLIDRNPQIAAALQARLLPGDWGEDEPEE